MAPRPHASRFCRRLLLVFVSISALLTATVSSSSLPNARLCFFFFSDVSDLGWTYAFNAARLDMIHTLEAEFPGTAITAGSYTGGVSRSSEERRELLNRMVTVDNCTVVVSNSDLIERAVAAEHPNTSFLNLLSYWDNTPPPPNMVVFLYEQFQPFYFMGVAAAHQSKSAVCIIVAWAPPVTSGLAANYFLAGVRSVSTTLPGHVVTTGSWYNPTAELTAAQELISLGCDVIARSTDSFDVDKYVATLAGDAPPTVFSMGVHIPLQQFVGDTALMSSVPLWAPMLLPYLRDVLTLGRLNGTRSVEGKPYDVAASGLDWWSVETKPSARAAATAALRRWGNVSANVKLCDGPYFVLNGSTVPSAVVTDPQHPAFGKTCAEKYGASDFIRFSNVVYHSTSKFEDGVTSCGAGKFYTYDRTPELSLRCVPCPAGTYRPPHQTKAAKQCTICPTGQVSEFGASSCHAPLPPGDSSLIPDYGIATLAFGALFIVVGAGTAVGVLLWRVWSAPASRRAANAPTSSTVPFAIVFTDIQASTALWAHAPQRMGPAIDTHHAIIRKCIAEHNGYEVKTIGDSFMVTFQTALSAINFSLAVQHALYRADWGTDKFDLAYKDQLISAGHPDVCDPRLWNGLRVRVAVNFGEGEVKFDETTNGYDYYGTVVNTAARVEAVGHGGQVLATDATMAALSAAGGAVAGAVVADLGPQPLRGLADSVVLHELVPTSLAARRFPPLRLDRNTTLLDTMSTCESSRSSITATAIAEDTPAESYGIEFTSAHGNGILMNGPGIGSGRQHDTPPFGPIHHHPEPGHGPHGNAEHGLSPCDAADPLGLGAGARISLSHSRSAKDKDVGPLRSARSARSTHSATSLKYTDLDEHFANAARKLRIDSGGPMLCLCYRLLEAVLSTTAPASRRTTVSDWAKAWRVFPASPWAVRVGKTVGVSEGRRRSSDMRGELLLVVGRALHTIESLPAAQRPPLFTAALNTPSFDASAGSYPQNTVVNFA